MKPDDVTFVVLTLATSGVDPRCPACEGIMRELDSMRAEIAAGKPLSAETRQALLESMCKLNGATGLSDLRTAIRAVLLAEANRLTGSPAAG